MTSFRLRENISKKGERKKERKKKKKCEVSKRDISACLLPQQAGAGKRKMAAASAHNPDFFEIPSVAARLKSFIYYTGLSGLPVTWTCRSQAPQVAEVR